MLLLLLPIAWLAVVIVVVAACQAAARGDARRARQDDDSPAAIGEELCVWDLAAAQSLLEGARTSRHESGERTPTRARIAPRRRHISHGIR